MITQTGHPSRDDLAQLLQEEGDARKDLAEHLTSCPDCRETLEQIAMGETGWLLQAAQTTAIPAPPKLLQDLQLFASPVTGETLARLETLPDTTLDELLPNETGERHRIGPYEVLGVVGRGGMGIVLQGHDVILRRTVALKIPTAAMRGDAVARGRFLREARAAASISHPHVVPVLAVEEYAKVPVLVMAFIQGESLQQRLDREKTLPWAEALRVGLETCLALEAAHERGLVHRDIKPANILLQSPNDHVRLTDFGLARAADDARLTQTGLGAGTPLYMSPEQASGESVDHRADLFALGSVLFTMVTGQAPFTTPSLMGTLRRLADGPPDSLRAAVPDLPRHIEDLIMDLLKNKPEDRPATASIVASRIRACIQFLSEGIEPPRQRRRRRVLTITSLLLVATIATAGTVLKFPTAEGTLFVEIDDPETKVIIDRDGKEVTISGIGLQEVKLKLGQRPVRIERLGQTREELVTITRDGRPVLRAILEPDTKIPARTDVLMPKVESTLIMPTQLWGHKLPPVNVPESHRAQTGTINRLIVPLLPKLGDSILLPDRNLVEPKQEAKTDHLMRLREAAFFPTPDAPVRSIVVSPDGKFLLSASTWPKADGVITVWDTATRKKLHSLSGSRGDIPCLMLTPDAKAAISGSEDGVIRFWDYEQGKQINQIKAHDGLVVTLAISPDGKILASAGADLGIQLRELATGKVIRAFVGGKNRIRTLAFSTDGKQLLSGGEDEAVTLWDVDTGKPRWTRNFSHGWIEKVAFSPNGKGFFAANRSLVVGDLETGEKVKFLPANTAGLTDIAFDRNQETMVTAGPDGTLMFWAVGLQMKIVTVKVSEGGVNRIFVANDGSIFLSCGGQYNDKTKQFTPVDTGIRKITFDHEIRLQGVR